MILRGFLLGTALLAAQVAAGPADFRAPERVRMLGYDGHIMEPFLAHDGCAIYYHKREDGRFRLMRAERADC